MKQMTVTSDFMTTRSHGEFAGRSDRSTTVARNTMRFLGLGFIGAALALWYAPGAIWDADVMMIKLLVSAICAAIGFTMMQMVPAPDHSEIQFDESRRELRLIDGASAKTVLRRSYDRLGGAKVAGNVVTLWDEDGSELVSLPITDDNTRRALSRQLDTLCA
jgi:hypothetical protein